MSQEIITNLRIRADIRRNAINRKSVQEGQPDRLADLLDIAAARIEQLEKDNNRLRTKVSDLQGSIDCANGSWL